MSRPSPAQLEANRNNAQRSRGPVSERGKQRSSQNALRHGLTGRIVVLPTEDMEAYLAFSKELVDSLNPATPMEIQLAQTVADTQWRLNRARTFEDGMIALGHGQALSLQYSGEDDYGGRQVNSALNAAMVFQEHSKDFVNLSLYEQRLSRHQKEAFKQLQELQAKRGNAAVVASPTPEPAPPPAVQTAAAAARTIPIPSNTSEEIGFVYSAPKTPAEAIPQIIERKAA